MSNDTEKGNIPSEEMEEKKENVLFTLRNILIGAAGLICVGLVFYFAIIKSKVKSDETAKSDEILNSNEFMKSETKNDLNDTLIFIQKIVVNDEDQYNLMTYNFETSVSKPLTYKINGNIHSIAKQIYPLNVTVSLDGKSFSFCEHVKGQKVVKIYDGNDIKTFTLENFGALSYCFSPTYNYVYYTDYFETIINRVDIDGRSQLIVRLGVNEQLDNLTMTEDGSILFIGREVDEYGSLYRLYRITNGSNNAEIVYEFDKLPVASINYRNNLVAISLDKNKFLVLNLTQLTVDPKTFTLNNYASVDNVIFSKNGKFLILAASERQSVDCTDTVVRVEFDFETLLDGAVLDGEVVPIGQLDNTYLAVM